MGACGTPVAVELGYALSSEEHAPADLVANARAAEEAGFGFALISDTTTRGSTRRATAGSSGA
jgi:hypothetical protein